MLRFLFALMLLPSIAIAECTSTSFAQMLTPQEQAQLDGTDVPYGRGLTWRATKGDQVIDLVGTIHVPDARLKDILARVAPQLSDPETHLLVEAGPQEQEKIAAIVTQSPEKVFLIDGPTVADMLDADDWAAVRKSASAQGIPSVMAAKMQPWFLALSLSIPSCIMQELAQGAPGLDNMIMTMAQENGITPHALEPWDTIFSLFGDDPIDEQLKQLRLAAATPELNESGFVALRDLYFNEDMGTAWTLSEIAARRTLPADEADETFAEMERDLLITRNAAWMDRLAQILKTEDKILIAVGAAHLQGEHGLLQDLDDLGWTLARF